MEITTFKIETNCRNGNTSKVVNIGSNDKDIYKVIAKEVLSLEMPPAGESICIVVTVANSKIQYIMKTINGERKIYEIKNTLPDEYTNGIDNGKKYLTCVITGKNAAGNSGNKYKFYEFIPLLGKAAYDVWDGLPEDRKVFLSKETPYGSPLFMLTYGRIAEADDSPWRKRSYIFPLSMFWIKYYEKIESGCIDDSDIIYGNEFIPVKKSEIAISKVTRDNPSYQLFQKLKKHAADTIQAAKIKVPITAEIIAQSEQYVEQMRNETDVNKFNSIVLRLLAILQRPISASSMISNMLAETEEDFGNIIERESELILAMKVSVDGIITLGNGSFADYDIEVYKANYKQKKTVMRKLPENLQKRVHAIYRVIPKKQQKKFNEYLENAGISNVKLLWHGSRNANWMSIVQNSLSLNPNAVITGKMFGYGIYFAPSATKSFGYTSMKGSYWAKGNDNTAFMGLYACAIGNTLDVNCYEYNKDYEKEVKNNHYNSLFAHKGDMLKNDEIVFYDEKAILLDYIVEFKD